MLILNMLILKYNLFTLRKSEKKVLYRKKKTDFTVKALSSKTKQRREGFGV